MKIQLPKYIPGVEEKKYLNSYNPLKYNRPSFTVDVLVFTSNIKNNKDIRKVPDTLLRILLVKRKNYPFKDSYALPGGFVEIDENLKDAAKRELKEETGIDNLPLQQLYTFGDLGRDPRYRTISTAYLCFSKESSINLRPGDDASDASFFDITAKIVSTRKSVINGINIINNIWNIDLLCEETVLHNVISEEIYKNSGIIERNYKIEYSDIAFDHCAIILYALGEVRRMVDTTDIIFNFLEDSFTLTELQKVYEGIKLIKESKANFRRKIRKKVIPTTSVKTGTGFRPPTLYKYNPDSSKY